jgi:hypothetical protein
MPRGKPAGVPCVQLDAQLRCRIFGQPERPAVCCSLRPEAQMCGASRQQAEAYLRRLEHLTQPDTINLRPQDRIGGVSSTTGEHS